MRTILLMFMIVIISILSGQEKNLAEALGYSADDRLLIINADDFGMCHAENMGTKITLEDGVVTSATIMILCPWALEAVDYCQKNNMRNIGVHVALTSEWKNYRWGALSAKGKTTLCDKKGYLWPDEMDVEMYADIEEVKAEVQAQLQKALDLGLDLSHFDSHMGSLYGIQTGRMELLAVAMSYSYEYGLPFRLPYMDEVKPFREMGFAVLDHLVLGAWAPTDPVERKKYYLDLMSELEPGVTEVYIHPAVCNEELRHITHSAKMRQSDIDIFTDPELKETIEKNNIKLITYEPLRKLQRDRMNWKPGLKAEDVYSQYLEILKKNLQNKSLMECFIKSQKSGRK